MRIGQGYDVHALVKGRKLILGGVTIPFEKGLAGHSDADVLVHAVCDALLGAAALGDIGRHFPDNDPKYKNADSRAFLREVGGKIRDAGFSIANVDATIVAEAPKMAVHIPTMVANLAADLEIRPDQVNVKAKTAERLGAIGRGEGIAAEAIALVARAPRAVRRPDYASWESARDARFSRRRGRCAGRGSRTRRERSFAARRFARARPAGLLEAQPHCVGGCLGRPACAGGARLGAARGPREIPDRIRR